MKEIVISGRKERDRDGDGRVREGKREDGRGGRWTGKRKESKKERERKGRGNSERGEREKETINKP